MRNSIQAIFGILLLSLVSGSIVAGAGVGRPEGLVDGFISAFNAHDAKAFGRLFAEDADWVSVAGIRVRGRINIEAEHHEAFITYFSSARVVSLSRDVRMIRPDVAVVHFNWELIGQPDQEGKLLPPRRGIITLVATKRHGYWKISAGQNTNLRVPSPS